MKPYLRVTKQPQALSRRRARRHVVRLRRPSSPRPRPARAGPASSRCAAGVGADLRRADRHVRRGRHRRPLARRRSAGPVPRRTGRCEHDDVGPVVERPVGAEQLHPPAPQVLVVEVGRQVVAHLDHRARRGAARPATPPAGAPGAASRAAPLLTNTTSRSHALGGRVDQERVAEVRRVEATDDQPGRRRPVT